MMISDLSIYHDPTKMIYNKKYKYKIITVIVSVRFNANINP
jgi:hypothetical protein